MNEEKQEELFKKYPMIFRQKDLSAQETCMCWGICVGDGWFNLIDELCKELTDCATKNNIVIEATQVKEKFGGLRFYTNGVDEKYYGFVEDAINRAEDKSYKTCEICGKPGKINEEGWLSVKCDKCRKVS